MDKLDPHKREDAIVPEKVEKKKAKFKVGDKVMVPRTGGGESKGEIIAIWEPLARVKFRLGATLRGEPSHINDMNQFGYKTIAMDKLRLIEEDNL